MPLSELSRESQVLTYSLSSQKYALVSNEQGRLARCWLTYCLKWKGCSCQQQVGKASQMLTYILFKTQSMLLSATSRKGQPDADLHPVKNPEHASVRNKQEGLARCWFTSCSKPRASSYQQQAGRACKMWPYRLSKNQSMLLSATSRKGQPNANLHTVQNPEHDLVSYKQEGPATFWLTPCLKPRACSYQ